jgi:hypothetical protein
MIVLHRIGENERLIEDEYDDSPWTREELQVLAWEAGENTEWEEYDDASKPEGFGGDQPQNGGVPKPRD